MDLGPDFGVKFANFKCFGDVAQGFHQLKQVNVVIGRNNSGKSALLDAFRFLTSNKFEVPKPLWHGKKEPVFTATDRLREDDIVARVSNNTSTEGMPGGGSHLDVVMRYKGALVTRRLGPSKGTTFVDISSLPNGIIHPNNVKRDPIRNALLALLMSPLANPLAEKRYRRLSAERRVAPEAEKPISLGEDGSGATNLIQTIINQAAYPRSWVEKTLLDAMNSILAPDIKFNRIVTEQLEDKRWEVFLEDSHKDPVGLSESGSGIKTVMLVLANLLLIPLTEEALPGNYVFAFEELENNLHPALLRRLLLYVLRFAREHKPLILLTTHSSVAIDALSREDDCQVVHVVHRDTHAECSTVTSVSGGRAVLDDLDIRASDILQSNGVIWVEGPSDRTYISHWIALASGGVLKEGLHYQCVHYGGKLLAHLSADSEGELREGVNVLTLNRNCCIVIDSDKYSSHAKINPTKQRIRAEVEGASGYAWITKGREIENYLPQSVVEAIAGKGLEELGQFGDLADLLEAAGGTWAKRFPRAKAQFAAAAIEQMEDADCLAVLDLRERIDELCLRIRQWNRSPDPIAADQQA